MTGIGTQIIALLAAAAAGGAVGAGSAADGAPAPAGNRAGTAAETALVIDASAARDGRDLVDDRLDDVDAEVRLPRTAAEARTNVRYFDKQGYRVVVAGPVAGAAADAAGVRAVQAPGVADALDALR